MKSELQSRLAENLKKIRKVKKLTQFELAEKANISEAMVKSIELSLSWPSDKTLTQLSEALEVDVFKFFLPTNTEQCLDSDLFYELKHIIDKNYNKYLEKIFAHLKIDEEL